MISSALFTRVALSTEILEPIRQVGWFNASAIVAALKGRIANFKVPKQVFVVNELPRNTMGKVQKNLLRQQHQGLFAR